MNFFEKCRACSVIVGNGSGVLFQPMTDAYTYVLTAKHNLDTELESIQTYDGYDKPIVAILKHSDIDTDIAILKIDKIEFKSPLKEFEEPRDRDNFTFYGYPSNRREQTEKIQNFSLAVGDMNSNEIIAQNESYYAQDDICGCSGGGVFKEADDSFHLVGIECRMDAQSFREGNNSRLRFIFIDAFDEIIEQNSDDLSPLYPPYLNDFSVLSEDIFKLNGMDEEERGLIRDRLKIIANKLSENLKPIDIKDKFGEKLLINGQSVTEYSNKELWSMYLEFIIISVFIDSSAEMSISSLDDIYKKRMFLFGKSSDWITLKENILKSNLHGLNKGGSVIVCCDGDRTPTRDELVSKTLHSAARAIPTEEFHTDNGYEPHKSFIFKHIHAVQKQMITSCDSDVFDGADASNIEGIIRNEINKVFN